MTIKIKNVQNNIKMSLNATMTNATVIPSTTSSKTTTQSNNTLSKFEFIIPNWNEEIFSEISANLSDIKIWTIIIAMGIISVILIKLFNTCTKMYKKHNEIIIKKHTRISPQI